MPALWRKRPASNPERNDATLARVTDTDAVYRALMDHAYQLLEHAAQQAVGCPSERLDQDRRAWWAGYASGLVTFIDTVERTRERAREMALEEQRRLAAQQHGA